MSARHATRRGALALAVLSIGTGCPGKKTAGDGGTSTELPASGKLAKPTHPGAGTTVPQPSPTPSPADDPTFPRAALFELYRAEILGSDAERHAALRKNGLEDAQAKPVAARVSAYEAALKRFATERADEWSAFTDEVEQARVAKQASAGSK